MNPQIRNVLIVIGSILIGGVVNMGIIMLGSKLVPPPEGVDPSDMESLKANMHLFQAKHFIVPFLAHALGTLAGAFLAFKFSTGNKMRFALIVGLVFLAAGIMSAFMLPAPMWFIGLDIILAYLPMAWLGGKLASSFTSS